MAQGTAKKKQTGKRASVVLRQLAKKTLLPPYYILLPPYTHLPVQSLASKWWAYRRGLIYYIEFFSLFSRDEGLEGVGIAFNSTRLLPLFRYRVHQLLLKPPFYGGYRG
jgi:hypothetical protein